MVPYIDILGLVAGAFTTLTLVPQIIKTVKMKETRDISISWILMLVFGTFLWAVYGILIASVPIALANAVSFLLAMIMMAFKFRYR